MSMKRIMLLGGSYFQMTATKAAKELGYYVISVDYLPDNPGHKYADEYHNISTLDQEAVLNLACEKKIDGIISYASDVSAPTAAYVASKLGLPTNPPESVDILTNKQKFRRFLRDNGFNTPRGKSFSTLEDAKTFCETLPFPVMVKPTDSAGSKGVHKVNEIGQLEAAWFDANQYSRNKQILVEEFIEKSGYQIDADSFLINGELAYFGVLDQHNDLQCNPFVPIGLSGPSVLPAEQRMLAKSELQRLFGLLNMKNGALNIEFIFDKKGCFYVLEVGPRNGGNLITDVIKCGSGVDLAKYTFCAATGAPCDDLAEHPFHTCVSSFIVHSPVSGTYKGLWISDDIKNDILRLDIFIQPGDRVEYFDNAGFSIGAAIIRFQNQQIMNDKMDHMDQYIKVLVD